MHIQLSIYFFLESFRREANPPLAFFFFLPSAALADLALIKVSSSESDEELSLLSEDESLSLESESDTAFFFAAAFGLAFVVGAASESESELEPELESESEELPESVSDSELLSDSEELLESLSMLFLVATAFLLLAAETGPLALRLSLTSGMPLDARSESEMRDGWIFLGSSATGESFLAADFVTALGVAGVLVEVVSFSGVVSLWVEVTMSLP